MTQARRAVILALHNLSYSSRVLKQAEVLVDAGFEVTIVGIVQHATDPQTEWQGSVRLVRVRTTKHLHAESRAALTPAPQRPGCVSGVKTFFGRMRDNLLMARAALQTKPDVVIASDVLTLAAGLLVKRCAVAPLILDVRDLILDSGRTMARSYESLLRLLERSLIGCADAITTVSPALSEVLAERYSAVSAVTAIYSGAFESVGRAAAVHSPLRLFFQGRLVANRRVDELIEAMTLVPEAEAILTIQGFGEEQPRLEDMVSTYGLASRVRFIQPCEPRQVVQCAAEHDVGVICYRGDTINLRVATPIKLIDYMAAGLAVLSSDLPGIRGIVRSSGCGHLFEQSGPESIAQAIRYLASDPELVAEMKQNSVEASQEFLASTQGERFLAVVESVLARRTDGGTT